MSIYKPCDIRGLAAEELTPGLFRRWGEVLGSWVEAGGKFVVAGDGRASTPGFLEALLAGLASNPIDCIQLGSMPTPMVYHAQRRLRAAGAAIVTASHNPAAMNGLKWMVGDRPPTPEGVERLRQESEQPRRKSAGPASAATPRDLDISFDYVAWLQETWVDALRARCRLVLDPMHGAWAGRARRYLSAIFPESLTTTIHDKPDADFGGRTPDCSQSDALVELCDEVYKERADLGVAFDGDGDRLALVDDQAMPLTAEETTMILLESLGSRLKGNRFVYDVKFSDKVPETARRLGAEALVERTGHAHIRNRMRETGAIFGAEISGHYCFAELGGDDDGLYTACYIINHLAQSGQKLSELRSSCPEVFLTPDLRLPLAAEAHQRLFDQVRDAWADYPQSTLDGLRVDVPGGWALVRSSGTEGAMTFRFESVDWSGLHDLVGRFCAPLDDVGHRLWAAYRAAMSGEIGE